MKLPLRSWKNLLGNLGLKLVQRKPTPSRRTQQRSWQFQTLERRDLMATLYWDTNGALPGLGGAGTWDTSTANWTTDPTGSSPTQVWNNAAGDEAVFTGTAGAVTLGTDINANGLALQTTGYSVTGTNTLTLGGSGEVNVAASVAATLSSVVAGSVEFKKTGTGTLTVTKDNTGLTGGSRIEAGTLQVNHNGALGSGTITLAGGKLQAGNGARTIANAVHAATGTTSGIVTPGSNTLTINGNLSGDGTINKSGPVALYLGGDNAAFAGKMSLQQFNIYFNTSTAGSDLAEWNIAGGEAYAINFAGAGSVRLGSITGTGGRFTAAKAFAGTKTFIVGGRNENVSYSGKIPNADNDVTAVALVKIGTGTLTLGGDNSFSAGTTIEAGNLTINHNSALGTGTITLAGGRLQPGNGARTIANAVHAETSTTSWIVTSGSNTLTLNGNLSGDGTINKSGPVALYLGGDNSAFAGKMSLQQFNIYFNTSTAGSDLAEWNIAGGEAYAINFAGAGSVRLGSITGTGGRFTAAKAFAGTKTFIVGGRNENVSYTGKIPNADNDVTAVALVKIGTGTLTLGGENTYSAGTTIEAGTIAITRNAALGTGTITLAGGRLQATNGTRTLSNAIVAAASTTSTVTAPSGSSLILNGNLSGTGTILKTGANSLSLGGNNASFSGTFSNQQNNVFWTAANAGSAAAAWELASNAVLAANFTGNATISLGSLSGTSGKLTAADNTTGTKTYQVGARNEDFTFGGTVADAAAGSGKALLTKVGTGTLELTGSITTSGGTSIAAGTLQVGNGGTAGSLGSGAIAIQGNLVFNRSDAVTVANGISGTGTLSQNGTGTLILGGLPKEFQGTSIINSGTLQVDAIMSNPVTINPGGSLTGSGSTGEVNNAGGTADNELYLVTIITSTPALGSATYVTTGSIGYVGGGIQPLIVKAISPADAVFKAVTGSTHVVDTNTDYAVPGPAFIWREDFVLNGVSQGPAITMEDKYGRSDNDKDYDDRYFKVSSTLINLYVPSKPDDECLCSCADCTSNSSSGELNAAAASNLRQSDSTTQNIQQTYKLPAISTLSGLAAIKATLTIGSSVSQAVYYDPSTVSDGDDVWLNLFVDASGESSGAKDWSIDITYLDSLGGTLLTDSVTGTTVVNNREESAFGNRWWRSDFDQLTFSGTDATIIQGDGQVIIFRQFGSNYVQLTADSNGLALTQVGSNYQLSDKYGNVTVFDSAGHLLSKTTATGLTTTYEYVSGHPDLLETVTTPDGDVTTYTYETYAGGTKWRVATMIEHDQTINSVTTAFTYNSSSDNLLTQTTRTTADMTPVVKTESFGYDLATKQLTTITDSESNTSTIVYDFAGRVTSIERSCGGTTALQAFRSLGLVDTSLAGDSPSNLATLTKVDDPTAVGYAEDERGMPRWFKMNDLGQTTWEKDALGNETTFTYDMNGNLLSMVAPDPDGAGALEAIETLFTYDKQGNRLTQVERTAVGHVVLSTRSWTYETDFGAVTSSTDELGRVTKYVIGAKGGDLNDDGRVLSVTRIVGLDDTASSETDDVTTTYTYGSVSYGSLVVTGLLTSVTDANGHTTTYEYYDNVDSVSGKLGLLKKIVNPDATFRTFDYDTHGNRKSATDELGRTTAYSYDGENRLISRTDPDPDGVGPLASPVTTYEYDGNDNLTKITDPLGRVTIQVYDNRTRLAERIEEGGFTTSYTYDCAGNLLTVTDPLGRVTTYAYDDLNRQISVTLPDPDGAGPLASPVMSTTYDALGRTLTRTDANDNVTTYGYDQHGFQTTVTLADPDGAGPLAAPVYTSVYNDGGQLIASIDPLGRTTTYGYDDLGRQITVTLPDPDGAGPLAAPVYVTTYDKVGNVLTRTDALGNVTSYEYNERNRVIQVTLADPDGAGPQSAPTMLTVYDDAGQVVSTTDALGRVTTYTYDGLGRRIAVTLPDPDGAGPLAAPVLTTTYDVAGQVLTTTDALGNVTSYEYDDLGRRVKTIQPDPDGGGPLAAPVWETVYDDASQVVASIDPLGRTTAYTYDNLGRTISVMLPDPDGAGPLASPVYTTTYDANGNVLTSTDALGNVTSYTYDALNRRTHTTQADPDGVGPQSAPVWETVYDIASQVIASIDPLGRTTTYDYDGLGRRTKVTSPDPDGAGPLTAAFTVMTYDAGGNVLSTEDAIGNINSYEYDNLYRLIVSANANLEETSFTYDLVGNRLTLTDPNGNTTAWEYDDLNRVVLETNELNKTRSYVYDVGSRLTSKVDRLGREVEYVYDNLNRIIEELWDSVSAYTWTYDAARQMLTGGNAATREYVYSYDALGRVTQVDTNEFGSSSVYDLNFTYDANNNRLSRTHAANISTWSYDYLNRATDVSATGAAGTYGAAFAYNAASQLTVQENRDASVNSGSPFSSSEYAYDGASRLAEIVHKDALSAAFASYGYTWNAGNRITAVDFLDGVYDNEDVDYGYDDAGQVIGADRAGSGTDEEYGYDTNGNRLEVTRDGSTANWSVGDNNQLTSDGTNSYTYDDEGNLTSDGVSTYYWDHRNRLIEVRTGSTGVMFTYDHNNLRVGKILDLNGDWDYSDSTELDTQTRYYFDGGRMVREVSVDGSVENNYLFGLNGQLIAVEDVANDVVEFAYNDHLGSVRDVIVVDAGAAVHTEHSAYDSFGRVLERQQFDGTTWNVVTSKSIVSLGYTGEYFEVTIGLQYNWNRWYNAETGRWISEDPIGFAGGDANLGRYAGNESLIANDHLGLMDGFNVPIHDRILNTNFDPFPKEWKNYWFEQRAYLRFDETGVNNVFVLSKSGDVNAQMQTALEKFVSYDSNMFDLNYRTLLNNAINNLSAPLSFYMTLNNFALPDYNEQFDVNPIKLFGIDTHKTAGDLLNKVQQDLFSKLDQTLSRIYKPALESGVDFMSYDYSQAEIDQMMKSTIMNPAGLGGQCITAIKHEHRFAGGTSQFTAGVNNFSFGLDTSSFNPQTPAGALSTATLSGGLFLQYHFKFDNGAEIIFGAKSPSYEATPNGFDLQPKDGFTIGFGANFGF